jgi:hypothetical protein
MLSRGAPVRLGGGGAGEVVVIDGALGPAELRRARDECRRLKERGASRHV